MVKIMKQAQYPSMWARRNAFELIKDAITQADDVEAALEDYAADMEKMRLEAECFASEGWYTFYDVLLRKIKERKEQLSQEAQFNPFR